MVSGKSIRVISFLLFGTVGYAQNDNCTGIVDSIGDGYCDQVNNNELCGYDQGINKSFSGFLYFQSCCFLCRLKIGVYAQHTLKHAISCELEVSLNSKLTT